MTKGWLWIVVSLGLLGWLGSGTAAQAQTGPAGVGNADGTNGQPRNVLWLRADRGVQDVGGSVLRWDDQSGNGFQASAPSGNEPTLVNGAVSGQPGVSFDRNTPTYLTIPDADALDATGGVTILTAVRPRTIGSLLSKRDGSTDVGYEFTISNECDGVIAAGFCFGTIYSAAGLTIDRDSDRFFTPNASNNIFAEIPQIVTGGANNAGQGRIYIDTEERAAGSGLNSIPATSSALGIGARPDGTEAFQGDLAEAVVFTEPLNQAQRIIVESYLSRKYDATVATTDTVGYAFGGTYSQNWAAIGRTGLNGSLHTLANSGRLRLGTPSFSGTGDRYVGFAHNGAATALGYETTEPVNGAPSTIARMAREWRFDLTSGLNNGATTVTLSLEASDVPSLPSGFEPALIVNSDPSFALGSRIYTLQSNGGRYEASIALNDGDVVTLGGVQRLVSVEPSPVSAFENAGTAPDLTLSLNHAHPAETGTDVTVTVTASEAGPFGAEGPGPQGGGADNDDASGNDYTVAPTGSVTLPAGTAQQSLTATLYNDAVPEQSQSFVVSLSTPIHAALGTATAEYTVLDDDNPRKVSFPSSSQAEPEGSGGGSRLFTVPIALPAGEPSAAGAPCTSVEVRLNSSSTALPGPLSDPLNDLRLVNEPDPGGACAAYQERLGETSARVHFEGGQTTADLKLRINEDDVADAAAETAVFDLALPYSSALASSNTQFTLTLNDDESTLPNAAFATAATTGAEGATQTLTVTLSEPVSREVSVPFSLASGATDATEGSDFSVLTASPLTFSAGTTAQAIEVELLDDAATELSEQVVLDVNTPTGAALGTPSRATIAIIDNDRLGATGPAGVGSRETNPLWLRADGLSASDGTSVSTWPDASGNGNDVTAPGTAPTFQAAGFGGQPSVSFNNTRMEAGFTRNDALTVFTVGEASADGALWEIYDDLTGYRHLLEVGSGAVQYGTDTDNQQQTGGFFPNPGLEFVTGTGVDGIFSLQHTGTLATLSVNASPFSNPVDATQRTNAFVIGDDQGGGDQDRPPLTGQIAEVILYSAALNATQRQIIQNALSAKYGEPLNTGDVYANGTYTREVFGIGRTAASDFHVAATQDGLRFDAKTGLDDGDFLLAGHALPYNSLVTSDVASLGPDPARSQRVWYADVTDSGGALTVDATFDLSEMNLTGQVDDPSQYRLIRSTGTAPFSWSSVATATETAGDRIVFRDLDVSALGDGYYTVLTINQSAANLDAQSLAISGTADNEAPANVNGGRGGDAGWRLIALPGSGANVEDLFSLRDDQLVEFNLPGEDMFYRWNASAPAGTTTGQWAASAEGDPLTPGRGYMLYVFDNANPNFEPVDPTLTINANNLIFTDTETDITVGDNTPAADVPLASNEEWFVLGNPYPASFDLGFLNLGQDLNGDSNADFNANVQIWDPAVNTWLPFADLDPTNNAVAPWQAFFVQRNAFNAGAAPGTFAETLTFDANGTTVGAPFVGGKSRQSPREEPVVLNLELIHRTADGDVDVRDRSASLVLHPAGHPAPDAYDAVALYPYAVPYVDASFLGLGTNGDPDAFGRLSLPRPTEPLEIPLTLDHQGVSGPVELTVRDWAGIPDAWAFTLIDTRGTAGPGDDRSIPLSATTSYSFSVTASKQTRTSLPDGPVRPIRRSTLHPIEAAKQSAVPRFRVRIEPDNGALPVEMSRFAVSTSESSAVLTWNTASEQNNTGFYVESQRLASDSSLTADAWTDLGFVEGNGTTDKPTDYRFRTESLDYGTHAFRLRQVDHDGSISYSDTKRVTVSLDRPWIVRAPYPNPARNRATLNVAVQATQTVTVAVYDLLGRRVQTVLDRELPAGETVAVRIPTRRMATGTYFVRVTGDGFAETRRLLVVR